MKPITLLLLLSALIPAVNAKYKVGSTTYLNCETCFSDQDYLNYVDAKHKENPRPFRYVVSHKSQAIKDQSTEGNLVTIEVTNYLNGEPTTWEEWIYQWLIEHWDWPAYSLSIVETDSKDIDDLSDFYRETTDLRYPLVFGEMVIAKPKIDLLFVLNSFPDLLFLVNRDLDTMKINPFYFTDKPFTVRVEIADNYWVYLTRNEFGWKRFLTIENTPKIDLIGIDLKFDLPKILTKENLEAYSCLSRLDETGIEVNLFCRKNGEEGQVGDLLLFRPKGPFDPEPCSPFEFECEDDVGGIGGGGELS